MLKRGLIFGREREARWTQVVGRRRHSFQNPLRQNYGHIKAVETLTTNIAVEGRVVFVGRARFPKGRPPGVVDLAGLQRDLAAMPKREIPLALRLEWEALIAQARQDRRTRREHLRGVRARHDDQATKAWLNPGSGTGWTRVIGSGLRIGLAIVIPLTLLGALANNLPRANHQVPRTAVERAPQTRASRPLATSPMVSRPTPPGSASTIASAPEAQPPRSQPEPPIRWADSPPSSAAWQRCNQARTAVLIDNSASNRQQRDHLCAAVQGSGTPDELNAGSGRSSVVVVEPWKTLHSAGELTPN